MNELKTMFNTLWNNPAAARKFIAALLGAIVVAVSLGLLPTGVGDWVAVLTAFLSALGVYAVRNDYVPTKGGTSYRPPLETRDR